MTKIVAGSAKHRQLIVPKTGTRPTSERVRESLFSRLEHRGYIAGAMVADLYAGSGALGLEAASRGAAGVVCVEAHAAAAKIIARNARQTGLADIVTVIARKVEAYLASPPGTIPTFDVMLLDPPYDLPEEALAKVLAAVPAHLAPAGLVIVERSKRSPQPHWPAGLTPIDERKMGDTRVWSALRAD